VRIQRYEGFKTDDLGIYRGQDHSIAWFTDSAGNGLSVVQEIAATNLALGEHARVTRNVRFCRRE
jgi:hypothetical protein